MSAVSSAIAPAPSVLAVDHRAQAMVGKRERTRQRILDAAFALIGADHGLGVRIEEVCVEAKISRGTFYNYFAGLDDLFAALAVELSHEFNVAVLTTVAQMTDCAERTDACMRYYLERSRNDPQWGWAMVNISAAGPLFGAETHASALATVEEGIARGDFDLQDAKFGRDLILGTCLATMISQLRDGAPYTSSVTVSRHVLRSMGVVPARIDEIISRPLPALVS